MGKRRKPGETENIVVAKIDEFIDKIQNENRCLDKHIIFTWLKKISEYKIADTTHTKSSVLYRARLIKSNDKQCNVYPFECFDSKNSMQPPKDKAIAMRANYERIPYLYCNTEPYGAMSEIRPYVGAHISLAEIRVKEDLKCLNLCYVTKDSCADDDALVEKYKSFLVHLSSMFEKPVEYGENEYDYFPTQRIAEYIKNLGYDGIVYNSAMYPSSRNVCIFNYDKCEAIGSRQIGVKNMLYDFFPFESKHSSIDIRGTLKKKLGKIYKSICGSSQLPIFVDDQLNEIYRKITGKNIS